MPLFAFLGESFCLCVKETNKEHTTHTFILGLSVILHAGMDYQNLSFRYKGLLEPYYVRRYSSFSLLFSTPGKRIYVCTKKLFFCM